MNRQPIIAIAALLVLFVVALFGNVWGTLYYMKSPPNPPIHYFVALGFLIAQPCLLCIWCALGGQKTMWRILVSMGMLVILTLVYAKILEDDGAPLEVTLFLCGIVVAIVAILQIPLWTFRTLTKQTIALPIIFDAELGASQFGIKHLLFATTLAAMLIALAKAYFPVSEIDGTGPVPWFGLITFLLFYVLIACLLTFLMLAAVFNQKHRLVFTFFLGLFLITAPFACIEVMDQTRIFGPSGSGWEIELIARVSTFVWSLAFAIASVLSVFYAIGFRLLKRTQ